MKMTANFVSQDSAFIPPESTLKLVHVIFRHGDRTPDPLTSYPNDPHKNETYYPYGLGELTNEGKRRAYHLGQDLRRRYDTFLGPVYTPSILEARSSNTNRTKMTLELVLAGLFPPVCDQIWENGLNWQPIPFNAFPKDQLFAGFNDPVIQRLQQQYVDSQKGRKELDGDKDVFRYIGEKSGMAMKSYREIFYAYMQLKVQKELGLELPEWSKKVFPQPLYDLVVKFYYQLTATTEMTRIMSGALLQKIVQDSMLKLGDDNSYKERKIFLYSGHETNIAIMLILLDVFQPHIPEYASCISFELHVIDDCPGFKIYYKKNHSSEPRLLKLPACQEFCPLDQFIQLVEEYFPEEDRNQTKRS